MLQVNDHSKQCQGFPALQLQILIYKEMQETLHNFFARCIKDILKKKKATNSCKLTEGPISASSVS